VRTRPVQQCTKLARRGGDTVCGGAVTCGERLTGDDKCGRIWSKVLEEVGEAVEEDEGALGVRKDVVVAEAHDDEDDGEHAEAHELDGFAAPAVYQQESGVVSRDQTRH